MPRYWLHSKVLSLRLAPVQEPACAEKPSSHRPATSADPRNTTASFDCAVCAGRKSDDPDAPIKSLLRAALLRAFALRRMNASEGPRRSLTAAAPLPLLRP